MPASKKSTSKATAKSPAPATKAPVKTAAAKPAPAPKPAAKPAAKKKPAPALAPAPIKAVATPPITTTIAARIDIGFGNALYIRGEGPGLSWDRGVKMACVDDDHWEITLGESARPFVFKFLVNDLSWSAGADYVIPSGGTAVIVPTFE